jgi:hypothetical protein
VLSTQRRRSGASSWLTAKDAKGTVEVTPLSSSNSPPKRGAHAPFARAVGPEPDAVVYMPAEGGLLIGPRMRYKSGQGRRTARAQAAPRRRGVDNRALRRPRQLLWSPMPGSRDAVPREP